MSTTKAYYITYESQYFRRLYAIDATTGQPKWTS
ncbi:hypothetical protein [Spirosoma linguale]